MGGSIPKEKYIKICSVFCTNHVGVTMIHSLCWDTYVKSWQS